MQKKVQKITWQSKKNSIKKKQRIKIKRGIEVQMIKNTRTLVGVHTHTGNLKTRGIKYKKATKINL
mgnify:FL=1